MATLILAEYLTTDFHFQSSSEVLAWLFIWSKVQIICILSSWCHCHPIVSCLIKIQLGLSFLVLTYPGCPGKEAVEWLSVFVKSEFVYYIAALNMFY